MNKLYYVKREVLATNIQKALTNKGVVYSVELADEKFQPLPKKKAGFTKWNKKQSNSLN